MTKISAFGSLRQNSESQARLIYTETQPRITLYVFGRSVLMLRSYFLLVGLSTGEALKLWLRHCEEAMTNKDERKQVFGDCLMSSSFRLSVLSPLLLLFGYVMKSSQFLLRFLNVLSKTYIVQTFKSFSQFIFVN